MNATVIGIDLGKRWFHLVGRNGNGQTVHRYKLGRQQLIEFMHKQQPALVGMETCCGAQYLARLFSSFGHTARLLPAQYVRPFVKSQKNDFNDALAISEAVQLPTMRFVPIRSEEQLDVQALHRSRDRLLRQRLALTNQIRGLLLDRGVAIPQGFYALRTTWPKLLDDTDCALTPMMRELVRTMLQMWEHTEHAIEELNTRIKKLAAESELCRRLQTIPGVGPLLATALVSAVGNAAAFRHARDLSAWVGLVPRQHSTGGQTRLLGITRRGNSYLRRLLVQGARAVWVWKEKHPNDPLHRWLFGLAARRHAHIAVCALASKIARIAWALLRRGSEYEVHHRSQLSAG